MSEQSINELKKILVTDSPILFTGAGFNYGAKLNNGDNIPLSNDLKEIIITKFLQNDKSSSEYSDLNRESLSKVASYAQLEKSKDSFNDFITDLLSVVKPAKYHFYLANYNWRKIYTTNIDNIIETIYTTSGKNYISHNSNRANTLRNARATDYIKLHGCVNNKANGFVFSSEEYVTTIKNDDYRFNVLKSDFARDPFIFIGYGFDDFNIDYFLNLYELAVHSSLRGRLFFISPSNSRILDAKILNCGGIKINWSVEEFLEFLKNEIVIPNPYNDTTIKFSEATGFHNLKKIKNKILNNAV